MILMDTYDPAATHPALPAVPAVPVGMGERAPQRVRLPAPVTTPLAATIPTQDAAWRAQAVRMAYEHDATCLASLLGHSARGAGAGSDIYAVPAAHRHPHGHVYRVSFTPYAHAETIGDGRYLCECALGRRGAPCQHVGAAYMLANRRAQVCESVALAWVERIGWAWATRVDGYTSESIAVYEVMQGRGRAWEHPRVAWDTRNNVALWCGCGAHVCAHIGAVAQRVQAERDGAIRAAHEERYARA